MNRIKKNLVAGLLAAVMLSAGCAEEIQAPESQNVGVMAADAKTADGTLTVTFMDVGQGNAILVENDGLYMLIDGGDRDYSSFVVSYLKEQGVEELEYVISSHYDADHLNGIVGALHAFSCETFLGADYTTDTKVYQSLLSVLEEKDLIPVYPDMGDAYTFGDAEFTVVCPDTYDYSDDNDKSIGIRLEYGDTSFLICGDASAEVEQVMIHSGLPIASDVYLASHHGSAYSSSMEFLEAVQPQTVVISAGMGNSYGHPTEVVLDHIAKTGSTLYRTDIQGTITVTSDGTKLDWSKEPCTDFRCGDELSGTNDEKEAEHTTGIFNPYDAEQNTAPEGSKKEQEDGVERVYILNTSTKKFHAVSCSSVDDIQEQNKAEFNGSRQELIDAGYAPCKRCHP